MVYTTVYWLNMFPVVKGISRMLSPRAIVTELLPDFNLHCKLEFGSYVQTHEDHNNSMAPRNTGAISLRPTGSSQGGYYFYSLNMGKHLNWYIWTELPMPVDVITRIEELAKTVTYDGSDFGQDADEHDPGIAGVLPSDVDNEVAEVMNLDTNAGNTGVLNEDHVDVQESNQLLESVPETPAELQVIESPPEPYVEHMDNNYNNKYLMIQQLAMSFVSESVTVQKSKSLILR